jgi:IS605 OrfB family transposase
MLVHQAFRYELAPTAAQAAVLANHAGAARCAWNRGLSVRRKTFERRGQTLTAMELHRLLNRLKRTPRYGWLYEVSKCASQEALRDLDRAYANYWRGRKSGRRVGLPRFKKRGRCADRFRLTGRIRVEDGVVVLPRIGRVATYNKEPTGESVIVVEDLHVAGMVRNRHLARAIADQGWGEFHRQLAYKTTWYGSRLLVAPRFYPSSKTCSGCGLVRADLPLAVRVFACPTCGLVLDRDLNAARNLARLADTAAGLVAASSAETRNACGEGSAGLAGDGMVELPSVKQERARVLAVTDA